MKKNNNKQYESSPLNESEKDNEKNNVEMTELMESKDEDERHISSSSALDDEQRIKVLSPSMLVFKRFIRNQLAITGVVFIVAMFLFSFVGGWITPYREDQVFMEYIDMSKDYAAFTYNEELRYAVAEGNEFANVARSQFVYALNNGSDTFSAQGTDYLIEKLGEDFYVIHGLKKLASINTAISVSDVSFEGESIGGSFSSAFVNAVKSGAESFSTGGNEYSIVKDRKTYYACLPDTVALASFNVFDMISQDAVADFDFQLQSQIAMEAGGSEFSSGDQNYRVDLSENEAVVLKIVNGEEAEHAYITRYVVQALYSDVFLTKEFKEIVKEYIEQGTEEFTYADENGETGIYTITRNNQHWTVKWIEETRVINTYEYPSLTHLVGTDGNGMDLLTRLMYGGRISLMIGFIVVIIELFIGVILGGISGYFGKWIDNLIMRLVDIFNSIPSLPLIIILGAMMDGLRVDPQRRMIYLMLVLGILGWPYVARLVRGQILSLREQEFMTATEATGISVFNKIFKHLVPNVIPQLIVVSTMSLGEVILLESTLSFLGLGVKFPFASWGNIINDVSNVHVMTNYWFVWIPAGFCILITVLGFNFIGDGLRDAFDPKMKR